MYIRCIEPRAEVEPLRDIAMTSVSSPDMDVILRHNIVKEIQKPWLLNYFIAVLPSKTNINQVPLPALQRHW